MPSNVTHPSIPTSEPGRPAPGPRFPRAQSPRAARLTACILALAATWLLILPALARIPAIRQMIARHEAHGVDPSAKFYSELPAMPMISQRVEAIRQSDPAAFGLPERPRGE